MILQSSFPALIWMVVIVNGDIAGVLHDEPMPDYMTMAECEESARQQAIQPANVAMGYTFRCVRSHRRPFNTGRYDEDLE